MRVPLHSLRALGLTLEDIAAVVRRGSLELSASSIDTRDAQVRVRTLGQRYDQHDFEDIVVLSRSDGTVVRLGDIARVRDDFQDTDLIIHHQGKPGVFVEVYRAEGEQVMDVAAAVNGHLADVVPSLPEGVGITVWNDESQTYSERLDLLLKDGLLGLLPVFIALALFLEIRLALWVVVGLIASGVGALGVMLVLDIAINTISLLAFVLAIGIIVNDAIVVAEHIHLERKRGTPGVVAAIRGTRRIRTPLTFAVLTSLASFTSLLFIPGGIGEIWGALPVVIIAMLLFSLAESVLILPHHLSRLHGPDWKSTGSLDRFFTHTQGRVDELLNAFVAGPLDRALHFATGQPAVVVAGAVGLLVVCGSLLPAGIITTTLADMVEGGGLVPNLTLNPEGNVATVEFKLVSAQHPDLSTIDVVQEWREEAGVLPHARGIAYSVEVIDLGSPVEAVLSHPDPDRLGNIATSVVDELRRIGGVFDVRSDHAPGVRGSQRHPAQCHSRRTGARRSRPHLYIRRRAAADRIPGRAVPGLRSRHAADLCAVGESKPFPAVWKRHPHG